MADGGSDPKAGAPATEEGAVDPLVQYVLLRRDLATELKWPIGALVAQGCHATTAAVAGSLDDPDTTAYLADMDRYESQVMHKVVLEAKDEAQLRAVAAGLVTGGIRHKLWIEQPEGIATCLATKPYRKSVVTAFFRGLRLFR